MSEAPTPERPKSTIRGGFLVHRRAGSDGRVVTQPRRPLFEHGSVDEARAEAARLAARFNSEFVVFQEVAAALPPATAAGEAS